MYASRLQHPDGTYFKVEADADCAGRSERVTVYTANPAMTRLTVPIESGDWIAYAAAIAPPPAS